MQITWTKLARRIPDSSVMHVILKMLHVTCYIKDTSKGAAAIHEADKDTTYWTHYTPEKWNYLHQIDASNALENGDSVK